MIRVDELTPGDLVTVPAVGSAVVIVVHTPHPIWPDLALVVWKLDDGTWSHDALSTAQEVGEVAPASEEDRQARLRSALTGT